MICAKGPTDSFPFRRPMAPRWFDAALQIGTVEFPTDLVPHTCRQACNRLRQLVRQFASLNLNVSAAC